MSQHVYQISNSNVVIKMRYCCIPHCTGRGDHLFPKDWAVHAQWRVAV